MARAPSPRNEASRYSARDDGPSARPPWLEEADLEDAPTSTLIGKRTFWALVIGMLGLIGGVALGVWLLGQREDAPIDMVPAGAEVPLVRSSGPWKEAPVGPGTSGLQVPGKGDLTHSTGDGGDPNGAINTDLVAEAPLQRPGTEPVMPLEPEEDADTLAIRPVAPGPAPVVAAKAAAAKSSTPEAAKPVVNAPEPVSAGGSTLQLGAFSSESRAREAWKGLSSRFSYLAGLTPVILPTAKDGKTLYRLRATGAGGPGEARAICGKLSVAGEACAVVG